MEIKNKYYVGAEKALTDIHHYGYRDGKTWACETEAEAVEHAKEVLRNNPDKKFTFVVKVIKIVERPEIPVVIKDVE